MDLHLGQRFGEYEITALRSANVRAACLDNQGTSRARLEGEPEARLPVDARGNLLCVRKRKFVVTTDSNHTRKVYPNLARDMILTAINQLWRADITCIRLRDESVFLAVILDARDPTSGPARRDRKRCRSLPPSRPQV